MSIEAVLDFWFKEHTSEDWFNKNDKFDKLIKEKFLTLLEEIAKGEHFNWSETPEGSLAQIIVLDQFSRNIFRNNYRSYSQDPLCLHMAQVAISKGFDKEFDLEKRTFFYMPYMHSESKIIHEEAVKLFSEPGLEEKLGHEYRHKVIIDRFGRYPHRNIVLGRTSTKEEEAFLLEDGSSF